MASALSRLGHRTRGDAVLAGRWLLAIAGSVTTATVGLLHPNHEAWLVFTSVSAVMLVLLGVSFTIPWGRLPSWAPVAFPLLVWIALAVIGLRGHGLAASYGGLSVLCFGYLGFTQPRAFGRAMLPVATASSIASYGGWSAQLVPRLIIAVAVWTLVAEVAGGFVREHTSLNQALQRAAHTDALTGVANRRDLVLRLATAGPGDCVVICDIDHFKRVNDTRGHNGGDRVLADFGSLLRASLRDNDYAARYGGEEFTLLLGATGDDQAAVVLSRLHEQWHVLQPDITFSAGYAICRGDRSNDATLAAADAALYVSKRSGRNRDNAERSTAGVNLTSTRTID